MSDDAFTRARAAVDSQGLHVTATDRARPWGGFLVLSDDDVDAFAAAYFPAYALPAMGERLPMSPKLLVVAPHRRLSWQFHLRRAEIWTTVEGPVGVACGPDDAQPTPVALGAGEYVRHAAGTRHRLIGLESWGIVAEIWEHTDPRHPSDEDDIVRLEDDYGR